MKQRADKEKIKTSIDLHDKKAWLTSKLIQPNGPKKLGPRYLGPYDITKQIGTNTFGLHIPGKDDKDSIFNVIYLRKYYDPTLSFSEFRKTASIWQKLSRKYR
jgi:hypothetical protein